MKDIYKCMNSQDILRNLGISVDVVLDNSETYDYEIAGFNNDYDPKLLDFGNPITFDTPIKKDLSNDDSTIENIKLCEFDNSINDSNYIYSGLTVTFNYDDFTNHFNILDSEGNIIHDYENFILNNDLFTYTGITDETHYFFICEYPDSATPTPTATIEPTSTPTPTPTSTETPTPTESSTPTPTPTDTPVPTSTETPTPTSTVEPTPTSTETPTPTDTPIPTSTETPTPTDTPIPTATNTPTPTSTETPTPTESSTPTPTSTETPTPTSTVEPTPTDTPVPTSTETPTPTESSTPTPTPTDTPIPTATETPVPTSTETPTPTATVEPTPTDTPIPTSTETPTPTPTDTPIPTSTETPIPTSTETPTPTATDTPVPTSTETPTPTPTDTPIPTATNTPTPTPTDTPIPTSTETPTPTSTVEPTPTDTPVPTSTETPTPTPTDTPIPTSTETPTPTSTETPTPTPTDTPVPTATIEPTPTSTVIPTSTPVPSPTPTVTVALWVPTPDAWFDASDTSSYTLSGSNLTSVTDKAGNFNMSVDGTPTRVTNGLNNKNVWDFSGSESLISSNSGPYSSGGDHWAIGVYQWHTTSSTKNSFWSADGSRTYAVSCSNANNVWEGEIDYDGSNSIVNGIAKNDFTQNINQSQWTIVSIVFNKSGNQIFGRLNGTVRTSTDSYNNSMSTNCTDLRMMRNRSGVKLDGRMAEYFHIAGTPGTGGTNIDEVIKAEGYLAHKWGLTTILPSNHPYKNTQPTV